MGLIPLLAVYSLEPQLLEHLPSFRKHLEWFIKYRPWLVANVASLSERGSHEHYQLAIVGHDKLERMLTRLFDPGEFLSDYGLRSLSRAHAAQPFNFSAGGSRYSISYEPGESQTGLLGGNSNWRGPVWLPLNYLMIEALRKYHHHYGASLKLSLPTGTPQLMTLADAADVLSHRLVRIFTRDPQQNGRRPVFGSEALLQTDPAWRDNLLFYEYYHGENGAGLGASHQTGWTALLANLPNEQSN